MEINVNHIFSFIGIVMAFGSAYLGVKLGIAELRSVLTSLKDVVAESKIAHKEQMAELKLTQTQQYLELRSRIERLEKGYFKD